MAENLRTGTMLAAGSTPSNDGTIEKWCYSNTASNCETYGGLYEWNEAMGYLDTEGAQGICPSGWHIPTDAEWYALENAYATGTCISTHAGYSCDPAGTALKAGGSSGLNFPFGGYETGGWFYSLTYGALLWSSSVSESDAWRRGLSSSYSTVGRYTHSRSDGMSVRCLKD